MTRKPRPYEKRLFEVVRDFNNRFYYSSIFRVIDENDFKIKVEKDREQMIGRAYVSFADGDRIDYDIRFNRIVNLMEDYTLLVPGLRLG